MKNPVLQVLSRGLAFVLSCMCLSASAETYTWRGPATGGKMTNNNVWKNSGGGTVTITSGHGDAANDIVFDCAALDVDEINVECPNDGWILGSLRVLNGTVTITSIYNQERPFNFGNLTNEIYVAEGATLYFKNGPSVAGPYGGEVGYATVVKTGGGHFKLDGTSTIGGKFPASNPAPQNTLLKSFYFRDGTLDFSGTSDGIRADESFRIGPGRTLSLDNDKVQNDTVLHVEKGGTLNGCADLLGAVVGEGTINYSGVCKMRIPDARGPYVVGGTMSGKVQILAQDATAGDNRHILLANANAYAQTGVEFETPPNGGTVLRFAPGIGTFRVKSYKSAANQPLVLEDTDGEPVRVYVNLDTSGTAPFTTGRGDYVETSSSGRVFTGNKLGHTGWIGVTNGYGNLTFGDLTAANDVDLTAFAGFFGESANVGMNFKNSSFSSVTGEVAGVGYLSLYGDVALPNFHKSGGNLNVYANTVLEAPDARLAQINVYGQGTLSVAGGRLEGSTGGYLTLAGSSGSHISLSNAVFKANHNSVRSIDVGAGSLWQIGTALDSTGSAEEHQTISLDGCTVWMGERNMSSFDSGIKTVASGSIYRDVYVKEGGVAFQVLSQGVWHGTSVGRLLSGSTGGRDDGGVTVKGHGWFRIDGSWADLTGPVRILGTEFQVNTDPFTLNGDVELGTTRFRNAGTSAGTRVLAAGTGKTVTLSGAAALVVERPSATTSSTYAFGPAGAEKDAAIVRNPGSALIFIDENASTSIFDGAYAGTKPVVVNGGLSNGGAGILRIPAFSYTNKRTDGDATSRYALQFLRYDDEKGLVEVYGTDWNSLAAKTADDVVRVDSASTVTVGENTSVGALRVFGCNGNALEIASGVTLTVGNGADPACVLLNNTHASGRGKAIIAGAGTLDFGAREGVISVNLLQSGSIPAEINCRIAGSGGVSYVMPTRADNEILVGGANTYTGDTRVYGGRVRANNAQCFGTGTVYAGNSMFCGGGVVFTANGTWANDFVVHGAGGEDLSACAGALRYTAGNVVVSGSVRLIDDVTFNAAAATAKATFNCAISGTADLYVKGVGTTVFGAVNTYRGKTTVTSGTLVLKDAGTFGDGPVVLSNATLRFENSSDVVVTNRITGTGRIVAAGTGRVLLADAADFTGDYAAEGAGVYDLNGVSADLSVLNGTGSFCNSGSAAELAVANSALSAFGGTIAGPIDFRKGGSGTLFLSGANTYSGATTVDAGTLVLGDMSVATNIPVADAILRLDASAAGTVVEYAEAPNHEVEFWRDADGRDFVFTNVSYAATLSKPVYHADADAANGRPSVWFSGETIRMRAGGACSPVTTFTVSNVGGENAALGTLPGIFGKSQADSGLRVNGSAWGDVQTDYVNGLSGNSFTKKTVHVHMREYPSAMDWTSPAVGDYFSSGGRPFGGNVCEIVLFDRKLNAAEQTAVNDYLMVKWGVKANPGTTHYANVLPAGTDVVLAGDATLALNDVEQTVATLAGEGTVLGQTAKGSVLAVTEDSVFAGTFGPGVELVVKAGATFTLAPGAVLDTGMVITLEEGATLDLSGQTFGIYTLKGHLSSVRNGTLNLARPWRLPTVFILR